MRQNDLSSKRSYPNEINFHIGMKKVQTGTADYVKALKKFLEKDELHQLKSALNQQDKVLAMRKIQSLKIKTLNLGLMNLYELLVEMEEVLMVRDFSATEELIEEVARSKKMILSAIA